MQLVTALALSVAALAADASPIGRQIENFELRDFRGKVHSLSDYADKKAIVVAFLGVECPLANLYIPRLKEIAAKYADQGVELIAVNSNVQDTLTELAGYAQRHEFTLPLLKDPDSSVADQFSAVRTPEVFLLDENRTIRYRGLIDDQFGIGFQKPTSTRNNLADAIDAVLAGKEVAVPETTAVGCFIGRPPKVESPSNDVTYTKDIAKIFNDRCVHCHRSGEVAPFPMTTYDEIVGWTETIREVIDEERMPPWFANPQFGKFRNDCRMPADEKALVARWIDAGAPEGDPKDLPAPPTFVDGWQIGEPDEVFYIDDKPVTVPAEGVVEYKYYVVDPGWTEDKWVQAAECRPGNRSVVHHIIAFIQEPNARLGESKNGIGGYAPGMPPEILEPGTAKLVKKGSRIIFQMHYTPNGSEQQDRSCVGVVYADPSTVKRTAKGGIAANFLFRIPPGADNHKVTSSYRFKEDVSLRSLTPHMHVRGKSFRFEATYPDGTKEVLLDVPHYDFNWQLRYELAEPKSIPKGTVLNCTAHFDNSEENLNNPDPTKAVRWGDQTWEEMMIGWFSVVKEIDRSEGKAEPGDDETAAR